MRDELAATGRASATKRGITTPPFDPLTAMFPSASSQRNRFLIRAAIRLTHGLSFTPTDEIAVGKIAVESVRLVAEPMSALADQLCWSDHVGTTHALATLGRWPINHRDFVVRCSASGLGEALNAEHEADELFRTGSVDDWLRQDRYQRLIAHSQSHQPARHSKD